MILTRDKNSAGKVILTNQKVSVRDYAPLGAVAKIKTLRTTPCNDIRDRYVEPYAFTTNYVQIWCYCQDENKNKLFKVSRIGDVEILPETWQNEADHRAGYIDIFRMNSEHTTTVKLKLNLRATNLLVEEYPLASKYLTKLSPNEWLLVTDVCSMDGVERFVMGLLDDIEIVESPELQEYIASHLKNYQNKFPLS